MSGLKSLIHEIHRRSVWQVIGIYLVGSWVALQVVDVLAQNFGLPDWFPAFALGLLVLGLPVVVATAFVQEGLSGKTGPEPDPGPRNAATAEPSPAAGSSTLFTWRNAVLGGVGAFALWGVIATGWLVMGRGAEAPGTAATVPSGPDLRSIAVLPFATRSDNQSDTYFSEGMHDDLLTQLSKIDSLTVISRTSVMQYAGTTKTMRQIAQELGVATVLEGGVQRAGDRVRVNVQLIEAEGDRHLWAETYDEELSAANVFAIQSDLAREIAGALRATLTPEVTERIATAPTESLEAYELYTRARYAWENRASFGEDITATLGLFEAVLAVDSTFAPAWMGLANTYMSAWNWQRMSPDVAAPAARAALDRALSLDPDLAGAHLTESRMLQFEGREEEAEAAVLQALALNPGSADVHARYARVLEGLGRYEEAVEQSRRAVELDPLSTSHRNGLADRLFYSRQFGASVRESERVVEMEPTDWYAWYNLGWAAAMDDSFDRSIEAFHEATRHAVEENQSPVRLGLAYAFARAGNRDSTYAYLEGSAPSSYDGSVALFELGDEAEAFDALEVALEADPTQLRRLAGDPSADGMRAHPRWADFVERYGGN